MQLSWSMLAILLGTAALGWFWRTSLAARERANQVAMEACERLGLQFLDGTVAFAGMTIVRSQSGRVCLRRTYVFDYTAHSIERRQGFVVLTAGQHVESIGFAPEPATPAAEQQAPMPQGGKVLDLEEWRSRRKRG